MSELVDAKAARAFFADRLEAHFKAHPWEWIPIEMLMRLGGPSWRSRICDELRTQRQLAIPWNGSARESAYMYRPTGSSQGPDAGTERERLLFDTHPRG